MKVINCVVRKRVQKSATMDFSCIAGALEMERLKDQLSKLDRGRTNANLTFRIMV